MDALAAIQAGLQVPQFKFNTKTGESLTISVYKGYVSLTVWVKGENDPLYRKPLNLEGINLLKQVIEKVLDTSYAPNNKESILFTNWNRETRTETPEAAILIGRDDRGSYYIETQFQHNGNKKIIKFNIMGSPSIKHTSNADVENEWAIRSKSKLSAMHLWLTSYVPIAILLTGAKRKGDYNNNGGNSNTHQSEAF